MTTFQSREDINQWLVRSMARTLKIDADAIETNVAFDRYGMDSVVAVELTGELEKLAGRKLSPTLMYDYPTVDALSGHLAVELALSGAGLAEAV